MAGCSPTSCSPNLHVESGADVEERFLIIRWIMDRQSGISEIPQLLEITNRHHAGARTREVQNRRNTQEPQLTNASHAGARTRESKNRRITQESELANTKHARRRLQNRRKQLHQKTAGIHNLQFSGERLALAPPETAQKIMNQNTNPEAAETDQTTDSQAVVQQRLVSRLQRRTEQRDRRIAGMERKIQRLEEALSWRTIDLESLSRNIRREVQDALCNVRMIPVFGGKRDAVIAEVRISPANV